ncbi:hypothetical protein PM082_014912 [Marasmius tenuissimus]|nr:hypothetical protein PM082_014912 [Marasmius tenuissimus]
MWHGLTAAEKVEYAEKAQHMAERHKKMYPDYVYRPSNPKHMRSDRGKEKSMKGKNMENKEPVPVTENQTSEKSHSKVGRDESNAPKEPVKSVRTMAVAILQGAGEKRQ